MKSIFVEIRCPFCGGLTHKKSETLLIQGFDSDYEEQLKNGSFFRNYCPVCGKETLALHNLMYVDKQHHFVLLIKTKDAVISSASEIYQGDTHIIKRYVTKADQISEKLRILEDELDDRCIEILKIKLYLRYRKQFEVDRIEYHDMVTQSQTLWFTITGKDYEDIVGIEYSTYDKVCKTLPAMPIEFIEIDEEWAMRQLQN